MTSIIMVGELALFLTTFGGRSLVVRGLSIIFFTLQPKFLNRVRSYVWTCRV